jgi:hypothetical protein
MITLVLIVTLVYSIPVNATEPSDVQLTYEFGSQTLSVNVSHAVSNTKTHYIEEIKIQKNGLSVLNRTYANQSYDWGMYDTFAVSTVVGDNLTVTVICKRGHSLPRWVIVTSTTATNPPPTGTTTNTGPPNGTPQATLDAGVAIAAGVGVVIFFIIFFAWLKPEYVPESLKQLGSRIRPGADWFGQKMSNLVQQIKTRVPSR